MDSFNAFFAAMARAPFDPHLRFALFYLAATILLAYVIWLVRGRPRTFLTWLVPRAVYTHRSNLVDLKLFLANYALGTIGVFGALVFTPLIAYQTLTAIAGASGSAFTLPPVTPTRALITTLIVVTVNDFCKYWTHRIHHEWSTLWPFHAVHHSADVLTPVTVARVHPVETVLRNIFSSVVVGVVQGALLYGLIGRIDLVAIGGANVIYVLFNTAGSNLRHSHIWLSYGRVIEHILISPAQHQIHHSAAARHFNKNYGSIFAFWDWAFGTLYIPDSYEELTFGVADKAGAKLEQPHPSFTAAIMVPFAQSWLALKAKLPTRTQPPGTDPATDP